MSTPTERLAACLPPWELPYSEELDSISTSELAAWLQRRRILSPDDDLTGEIGRWKIAARFIHGLTTKERQTYIDGCIDDNAASSKPIFICPFTGASTSRLCVFDRRLVARLALRQASVRRQFEADYILREASYLLRDDARHVDPELRSLLIAKLRGAGL